MDKYAHLPLAQRPDTAPIVREILAGAPELEARLGRGMISDRAALAAYPGCPPDVLDLLADDRPTVVLAVARNPHCPPAVLGRIVAGLSARTPHWTVDDTYLAALGHPDCPAATMAQNLDLHARTVLGNPSCPLELARRATRSRSAYQRLAAVECYPLPAADLVRLVGDDDWEVALAARWAVLDHDWPTIRAAMLSVTGWARRWFFERLREPRMRALSEDPDPWLRRGAARYTSSRQLLGLLADDPNGHVRRAATQRLLAVLAA